MKNINITFEDEEVEWLEGLKVEKDMSWREFILDLSNYEVKE